MGKKKLSTGWIVAIVVGAVVVIAGAVVGVLALNGMFDTDKTGGESRNYNYDDCVTYEDGKKIVKLRCLPTAEKPMIYLYPETETEVSVKLGAPEKLSVSYPLYEDGWKVLAEPSGKLTDLKTGRELYSLYWEGKDSIFEVTDEGFVVTGENAATFLEEKLALLGLTDREAEEFIVYWLPKMQENSYNYVRFASSAEIEEYMPLLVSPKPDTMIRVAMVLSALDEPLELKKQVLPAKPERAGFTVVEWGGSLVK